MVSPRIFPKLGNGDENPAADAPCWQTPRRDRDQVVQCSLANGEHLCRLLSARQDFAFSPFADLMSNAPGSQSVFTLLPRVMGRRMCLHLRSATALPSFECVRPDEFA